MIVMLKNVLSNQNSNEDEARSIESNTLWNGKKLFKKRKRKKTPFKKKVLKPSSNVNDDYKIHFTQKVPAYKLWESHYNDFDDNGQDYFVDFYEDKNYEYIDQEDSESMNFDDFGNDLKFNFNNINYDNYEYEDVGVLNFRDPIQPTTEKSFNNKLSKRRFPISAPKVHYSRDRYNFPKRILKRRLKSDPLLKKSSALTGLQSSFDVSSLITIAGLWIIWQIYLVRFNKLSLNI